jgi:hypothetical protein
MCFETGSYANGGIMRIAPIGLLYHDATPEDLKEAVKWAIVSSHVNAEAVDGGISNCLLVLLLLFFFCSLIAFLQAYVISRLLKMDGFSSSPAPVPTTQSGPFLPKPTPVEFVKHIKSLTTNYEICKRLDFVAKFLEETTGKDKKLISLEDVLYRIGMRLYCNYDAY